MQRWLVGVIAAGASASDVANWRSAFETRYDAVILGTGLKESLLAGLLANRGKKVLQLDRNEHYGGAAASLDLSQLYERLGAPGEQPNQKKLGTSESYRVDLAPKVVMAHGAELQLLVHSGAWKHMDWKRVQRSFIYRKAADGKPDVHRVLATVEDVLKTRMLTTMQKSAMVRLFTWLEQYEEDKPKTHSVGVVSKTKLNVHRMSAAAFLRFWEVTPEMTHVLVRGMALHDGPMKALKKMPAAELLRKLKRYKNAYKTFPHMTSPYVYPSQGIGSELPKAVAEVLKEAGGQTLMGRPIDRVLFDESGKACGVASEGVEVSADCVIADASYVPDKVAHSHQVVRLYAILAHPPHKCKEAMSCQLIIPAEACGRKSDVYLFAGSQPLRLAPSERWIVTVSAKVEGETEGLSPMAIAKRELAAALPLLKPAAKMFAELSDVCEPSESGEESRLFVPATCDASSNMGSAAADVDQLFERITGEALDLDA